VQQLHEEGVLQPVLFRFDNGMLFIKLDQQAMPVTDASCFTDAIEMLFKTFYVLGVQYPPPLKLVYGLVESALGMPLSIGRSAILSDFVRDLKLND